jgi:hypothetical protein
MFVLFFISVGVLSFSIPQIVYSFKEEGEYRVEKSFALNGKIPVLKVNEVGLDDYDVTSLTLKGYEGTELKLVQRFEAQGNTRKVAGDNARMIDYNVTQSDSIITFDSNITFKNDAKFRAQRLNMDLFIPYNTLFVIEEGTWRLIDNNYREYDGYRDSNFNKTWKMTRDGFECVNCLEPSERKAVELRDQFGLREFSSVDLSGLFDMRIEQGDVYAVQLDGPEREKKRYDVYRDQETLVIEYKNEDKFFWKKDLFDADKVKIIITMPELKELNIKGAGKVIFDGFREQDLELQLTGAVTGEGNIHAENLTIDLEGASTLELRGSGQFMEANLTGACGLRAYNYEVNHAIVEAHGASSAKVFVTNRLEIDKGVASSISHRGEPEVITRN